MKKYIEREALLRHLNDVWLTVTPSDAMPDDDRELAKMRCDGIEIAMDAVEDFPAADVVPVRHGRWIEEDDSCCGFYATDIVCSECNKISEFGKFSYCPNCGARMDGDGE